MIIPDTKNWNRNDYIKFIADFHKYVLSIDSSKLSAEQKKFCASIIKDLHEMAIILSTGRLTRKTKSRLDDFIYWCVMKAIMLFFK